MQLSKPHNLLLRTRSTEELQSVVATSIRPVCILRDSIAENRFVFQRRRLSSSFISVLHAEREMDIELHEYHPEEESCICFIQLKGSSLIAKSGSDFVEVPQMHAYVTKSNAVAKVHNNPICHQFFVRFEMAALQRLCSIDADPTTYLNLNRAVDLSSQEGAALRRYVYYLLSEIKENHSTTLQAENGELAERLLLHLLARGLVDDDRGTVVSENQGIVPEYVIEAERCIIENLTRSFNVEFLAEKTGVSERTLHRGFKTYRGYGPIAFWRARQLELAHEELLNGDPGVTSVTDIAFALGFNHLSNFASLYKRRYGCLPSETLKK